MIATVGNIIERINQDLSTWASETKPWFRGESEDIPALCPKIHAHSIAQERYLLESFRRKAGGLSSVPLREYTDMWLFLAQHYGVPTRLLDWTEGALHALYFAINRGKPQPRVYMLHPRKLNELAGSKTLPANYPLSWVKGGGLYVALSWQNRTLSSAQQAEAKKIGLNLDIPLAFPATYQDQRMIAQRSCFTIHGKSLMPLQHILTANRINMNDCLFEYKIDANAKSALMRELSILGVSAATVFPDLDHLATDIKTDVTGF